MLTRAIVTVLCILTAVGAASPAFGDGGPPQLVRGNYGVVTNATAMPGKARQDTLYLMGTGDNNNDPGSFTGRFENPDGTPNWHGWNKLDLTSPTVTHWNISTYNGDRTGANPSGTNNVAYCGDETIPSCGPGDPVGGYGNDWTDFLDWMGSVPDGSQPTTVALDYYVSSSNEPDYDYLYFKVLRQEGWEILRTYNGVDTNVHEVFDFSVGVEDYVGPDNDMVHLRFEFSSDAAWSDEDCLWPTNGAAQIDDIEVRFDDVVQTFDDFESKSIEGNWFSVLAPGVGNFAELRRLLSDLDPCVDNPTWQATFIDDGEVVPELPGTECISWCYGPDGWIVNPTGGLAGPDFQLLNQIVAPAAEWPAGNYDGATLRFLVYRHEELGDPSVWPGMFYQWGVRSVDTGNPADLEEAAWQDRNFVYFGGPDYIRSGFAVSDLLVPGRTHVQWMLQVNEYGVNFGWVGTDGTPAPYFDNVAFLVYPFFGPAMATREIDIFQDTFPERGSIDYGNLQVNWCRFDGAQDVENDVGIVPADSAVFDVSPVRGGAELTQDPRIFYKIRTNPLFNGVRSDELGTPDGDGIISGSRPGSIVLANGIPQENRYAFDLPDTGMFYPGDQLHYYIWAEDAIDGAEVQASTLPADISQFGNFDRDLAYSPFVPGGASFRVSFLPTMNSATPGDQPKILFWNDFANRGLEAEWHTALRNAGYIEWIDWDIYYTNGPSSAVGNGLGSRATDALLAGYDVLLYSVGDLATFTINVPDLENDESPDNEVLAAWFELGNKKALFSGDNLAYDLAANDVGFLNTWLGIDWEQKDIRGFIDAQTAPLVLASANNPVFAGVDEWIAYGGCPGINEFDGVSARGDTEWIAEFTNPQGLPGGYDYPAATFSTSENGSETVYLPYDLGTIGTPRPGGKQSPAPLAARAVVLRDILIRFGQSPGTAVDVPATIDFAIGNYPNPFNPSTTIKFTLPRSGNVSLKIYNVRGELVRTLINDLPHERGANQAVWEGDNDQGSKVASGVYFYEVRSGDLNKVAKMALVK